jgi:hypothetical protein
LTRRGSGEKASIGPRRRPVNGLNGPPGKESQDPSAWAIAVGLSNLTLRAAALPFPANLLRQIRRIILARKGL